MFNGFKDPNAKYFYDPEAHLTSTLESSKNSNAAGPLQIESSKDVNIVFIYSLKRQNGEGPKNGLLDIDGFREIEKFET